MDANELRSLTHNRLADADNAYCGGDSEHYSEATAAAAIAQAAALTRLADNNNRAVSMLDRIATTLEDDNLPPAA